MSLSPQRWTIAMFDDQNAVIGMTQCQSVELSLG